MSNNCITAEFSNISIVTGEFSNISIVTGEFFCTNIDSGYWIDENRNYVTDENGNKIPIL